jgi:hypothetical protein
MVRTAEQMGQLGDCRFDRGIVGAGASRREAWSATPREPFACQAFDQDRDVVLVEAMGDAFGAVVIRVQNLDDLRMTLRRSIFKHSSCLRFDATFEQRFDAKHNGV